VLDLLKAHRVALTLTDGKWFPRDLMLHLADTPTAPFAYVRWMGLRELTDFSHIQIDRTQELAQWVEAFGKLRSQVSLIVGYFNNHFAGHSPASSNQFKRLLGLPVVEPESLSNQPSLF